MGKMINGQVEGAVYRRVLGLSALITCFREKLLVQTRRVSTSQLSQLPTNFTTTRVQDIFASSMRHFWLAGAKLKAVCAPPLTVRAVMPHSRPNPIQDERTSLRYPLLTT
jgi:hypothetical protein